jgi:hypothetical protein
VKHSLLPRDGRKRLLRTTTGAPHTGVETHRPDARQFATARARRSCQERRALRNKVMASKEGATRRPTHLRCHSSLRRHQDAAWTAHVTAGYRTVRRKHTGGARVEVCRWQKHPAYGTANKLQPSRHSPCGWQPLGRPLACRLECLPSLLRRGRVDLGCGVSKYSTGCTVLYLDYTDRGGQGYSDVSRDAQR